MTCLKMAFWAENPKKFWASNPIFLAESENKEQVWVSQNLEISRMRHYMAKNIRQKKRYGMSKNGILGRNPKKFRASNPIFLAESENKEQVWVSQNLEISRMRHYMAKNIRQKKRYGMSKNGILGRNPKKFRASNPIFQPNQKKKSRCGSPRIWRSLE